MSCEITKRKHTVNILVMNKITKNNITYIAMLNTLQIPIVLPVVAPTVCSNLFKSLVSNKFLECCQW